MSLKRRKLWMLTTDVAVLLLWLFAPAFVRISEMISPPCPVRALTGFLCPTCGGTHAVSSMINGDLWGAACQNAFVLLLAGLTAAALLLLNCACFFKFQIVNKLLPYLASYKLWLAVCAAAWLFAIVRNIVLCAA